MNSSKVPQSATELVPDQIDSLVDTIFADSEFIDATADQIRSLLAHLKHLQAWELSSRITKTLMQKGDSSPETLAAHLIALRGLDRYESALELLRYSESSDNQVLLQRASILCEAGDFGGVIKLISPLQSTLGSEQDQLLALLGWSHLYTPGVTHHRESIEIYRKLCQESEPNKLTASDAGESDHPAAYEGAQRFPRNMRKLVHFWYRKGYAAALERLPSEAAKSQHEWESLLSEVEPDVQAEDSDPLILRIAALCCYHLKRNEQAISIFKRAIESGVNVHRTQFEFALTLWCAVGARTALNQFRRGIADVKHISALRRIGILYVTLFDLAEKVQQSTSPDHTGGTRTICKEIFDAIQRSVEEIAPSLRDVVRGVTISSTSLMEQMQPFLSGPENTGSATFDEINWTTARIVGIPVDAVQSTCSLTVPFFETFGASRRRFTLETRGQDKEAPTNVSKIQVVGQDQSMIPVEANSIVSPSIRIIYFSSSALKLLEHLQIELHPQDDVEWKPFIQGTDGVYASIQANAGKELLDHLSRNLAKSIIRGLPHTDELTTQASLLSLNSAQQADSIYVAALCFAIATGSSDICSARPDLPSNLIPDADQLTLSAQRFSQLAQSLLQSDVTGLESSAITNITQQLVSRAAEIGGLRIPEERKRQAEWAASEIRAVLPQTAELDEMEYSLVHKLLGGAMVYLDTPAETLLLAQDPAFFCATRSVDFSRPALDTFAFFKASSIGWPTQPLSGTVTQKALAIRR